MKCVQTRGVWLKCLLKRREYLNRDLDAGDIDRV